MHRNVVVVLFFLSCLAITGCGSGDSQPSESTPFDADALAEAAANEPKLPAEDAEVFSLTVEEFRTALKADHQATVDKYKAGWIELTGWATTPEVQLKDDGTYRLITLLTGSEPDENGLPSLDHTVVCMISDPDGFKQVAGGNKTTVRGGLWADGRVAMINQCEIVKTEGDPPLIMTAEELAKVFEADPDGAKVKYKNKTLVVSGEVLRANVEEDFDTTTCTLVLKAGDGEFPVNTGFDADQFELLKPGDSVEIVGEVWEMIFSDEGPKVGIDQATLPGLLK